MARHSDSQNKVGEFRVNLIKDTVAPSFSYSENLDINTQNHMSYTISGTCNGEGNIVVKIGSDRERSTSCADDSWSIGPINAYNVSLGTIIIVGSMVDLAGNKSSLSKEITNSRKAYWPYYYVKNASYALASLGGVPANYIATISVPQNADAVFSTVSFAGADVAGGPYTEERLQEMGLSWKRLFLFDSSTGHLSLSGDRAIFNSLFDDSGFTRSTQMLYLSHMAANMQKSATPLPQKFTLGFDITEDGASAPSRVNIEVAIPTFGSENCNVMDWSDDLTTEEENLDPE